jgi:hypothetical protein
MVLSCSVVDPPPVRIIGEAKVQDDSLGRFVQPSCTGWLKPFAGEIFTITLAICPTLTVIVDAALTAKLPGDVDCVDDTTSIIAGEALAVVVASPA